MAIGAPGVPIVVAVILVEEEHKSEKDIVTVQLQFVAGVIAQGAPPNRLHAMHIVVRVIKIIVSSKIWQQQLSFVELPIILLFLRVY